MGHKINPKSFRLGIVENWSSRWFNPKSYRESLEDDDVIRTIVRTKLRDAGVDSIRIEHSGKTVKVSIKSAKPGLVIGRSGKGIDDLRREVTLALAKMRKRRGRDTKIQLSLDIEEIKRNEISAAVIGQNIASDIERRLRFRRVIKQTLEKIKEFKEVKGAKIRLSGRLDGSEIARSEWLSTGKIPLQTLRSNIDYAEETAFCSYGAVGIKVWIYKGEIFKDKA